jgi:hypothetical protein
MATARIVLAQGLIDGVNRVFSAGVPYVAGSTVYILNGRLHSSKAARGPENDYGYTELDPDSGTIEVDIPPVDGDVVQIFFWDRLVAPPLPFARLIGTISAPATRLTGVLREVKPTRLVGVLKRC